MKDMTFDFSVDTDGDIEEVSPYTDTTEIDCTTVMNRILGGKKLGLGERTEGNCVVENDIVKLDYRVCTELGEDWDTDVWDDVKEEFPLMGI